MFCRGPHEVPKEAEPHRPLCAAHAKWAQRHPGEPLKPVGADPRGARYESWTERLEACALRLADAADDEAARRARAALAMAARQRPARVQREAR